MGKRRSAEDFDDNSAGDSVDKLHWRWITVAGDIEFVED